MSQSARTIGLWLLLIVMFVGFYQFFTPGSRLPGWSVAVGPLLFLAFIWFARQGGKNALQGNQLNSEGITLMANGRLALALEKFEAARPLVQRGWKSVIAYNIGLCQMGLWRLDAAELEFSRAMQGERVSKTIQPQLLPRYALLAALRGDLPAARERGETARRVEPESALLVLMEGVLACRRAEWNQARTLLEGPATHILGGTLRGLRDALLCWSVERTSGQQRYLDLVTVFGEASTDKLRESWPELVDYLLERSRART
jgi:hypothetical protein